jgi:hypothetical protein
MKKKMQSKITFLTAEYFSSYIILWPKLPLRTRSYLYFDLVPIIDLI